MKAALSGCLCLPHIVFAFIPIKVTMDRVKQIPCGVFTIFSSPEPTAPWELIG